MKKNIAILSIKDFRKAPRIDREIKALSNDFNIQLIGEHHTAFKELAFYNLYEFRTFFDKMSYFIKRKLNIPAKQRFSKLKNHLLEGKIELLIIHEPHFLPLAVQLKKDIGIKIVFNAHEYHPLEFEDRPEWLATKGKQYTNLYQNNLNELDLFINVSDGIQEKCKQEFGVDSIVIPNASYYQNIEIKKTVSYPIRMVHHGVILPTRQIEKMVETVKLLGGDFTLDIMGIPSNDNLSYFEQITQKIKKTTNVQMIEKVEYNQIICSINSYDVGLYYLEDISFNNTTALPNKFFEFIQARLAIAITPMLDMKSIVEKYDIGVVSKESTIDSMVESLKNITPEDIQRYKENTVKAAKIESADEYQKIFLKNILSLTK